MRNYATILALIPIFLFSLSARGEVKMEVETGTSQSSIERVALFNTGIGYFERIATIKEGLPLKLTFKSEEINDVLKSLVFFDVEGGKIERVDYPSRQPLSKLLESYKIDILKNKKLSSLLNQLRGEEVEIEANKSYRGMIISVETREEDGNTVAYLNLLTSDGIISRSLDDIKRINFLNPEVESQLTESLRLIAEEHNRERKELIFYFSGSEKGKFRIAYLLPTPVWKMSYRLVIKKNNKPILQGWAIVENTTGDNWNDISLSLVSGNPISFLMDLYTPIFVKRPEVKLPLPPNIKPQVYGGVIEEEEEYEKYAEAPMEAHEKKMTISPTIAIPQRKKPLSDEETFDITGGIKTETKGMARGNFFSYTIDYPITIPVHKSTMIPIINTVITGKEAVIYNEEVMKEHPLNGYELINSTGLYLAGGPISVFRDGIFAGDAQIETIAPGEKRLITFSVDLDTEIVPERKSLPQLIESVKIVNGILESRVKLQRSVIYKINNRGEKTKNVLIEQRSDPDWKLVKPVKPYESTRDTYRFLIKVGGVESSKHALSFEVKEERVIGKKIALIETSTSDINFYLQSGQISEKVRKTLEKIARLKRELSELEENYKKLQKRYTDLSNDQNRIRNNMQNLDRTSNLYIRYVKILEKQEDEIEKILEEKESMLESISLKKKEIENFLNSLEVE